MNAHVMQAKFKVGDRVRVKSSPYSLLVNEKSGRITGAATQNRGHWRVFLDNYNDDLGFFEHEIEHVAPSEKFKVGDKVRFNGDGNPRRPGSGFTVGNEYVVSAVYGDRISVEKDDDGDANGWMAEYFEPAPLTIVAGRYYKTRDGRRVGPMVRNISDGGNAEYYWSAPMGQLGSYGTYWCKEGAHYKDGEQHNNDIIAEWPDETEKAIEPAKPYRTSVAAQVDTIADEYGAGAKPKFKVGDRVRVLRTDYPNRIAVGEITHIVGVDKEHGEWADLWCRDFPSGLCFYPGEFELVSSTPAIVALIENGQPLPARRPYVHPNRASAEAESKRLAGKHPGKEFGVYEFVSSAKEAKTYAHEWQRLAASGRKIDAIRDLRAMSGLGLATAKRAVEDWLSREAA